MPSDYPDQPIGAGSIGVIMLDTKFPRFPGDIGNPHTWPFNVEFRVVSGATAQQVVCSTATQQLQPYIDAALELQTRGVGGVTTSCGFLSLVQKEISRHLSIPFIASSLVQLPWVQTMLPPGKHAGILTINANALSRQHLLAAGITHDVPIKGIDASCEFHQAIMNDAGTMGRIRCEQNNVEAAVQFVEEHPTLGAIVLECTNMAPYANAIHQATRLPVYSIYTLIRWFQAGLMPRQFASGPSS